MLDLFREIFQTLRCNRMRTALTGLAVAWGIFMLIALVGMTKGVINVFEHNVAGQGTNTLNVWPGFTSEPWHGYRQGRRVEFRTTDMDAVAKANPGQVSGVTSSIYGGGIVSTASDYLSSGYTGAYPAEQRRHDLKISAGRFINDRDLAERRKVMVISSQVCDMLFPKLSHEEIIGRTVDCQSLAWTIVGIYESRWDRTLYIPFTTAALLAGNTDRIDNM
ncbi:MAG: ABC transporter permease, partial [Muribaculaceae bacterium]|nr:ABC transporter permease [Muribaculaceae bacterium]